MNLSNKPLQTLYGHDDEVTAVHISSELDLAVSASKVYNFFYLFVVEEARRTFYVLA